MPRRKKRKPIKLKIKNETLLTILGLCFMVLGVLIMISFTGQGALLSAINEFLVSRFGIAMLILPFLAFAAGLLLFDVKWPFTKPHVLLGGILVFVGVMGSLQSGTVGAETFDNVAELVTSVGAAAIFVTMVVSGVLIMTQMSFSELAALVGGLLPQPVPPALPEEGFEVRGSTEPAEAPAAGFKIPKLSLPFSGKKTDGTETAESATSAEASATAASTAISATTATASTTTELPSDTTQSQEPMIWEYPPLNLLSKSGGGKADRGDVKKNAQIIENTLDSFGIKARVVEVNYGPSITQYALEISRGTKLSKITGLATDLALALAAPTGQIRIEAPIAGRSLVGIEVPNKSAQYVTLRTMLASDTMRQHKSKLAVALGINVNGEPVIADIAKMPHILIAGATGSGKSVCVNAFMSSILFRSSPQEVKFILVDPKRVELTAYNNIPHLLTPVIVEPNKVVSALKWATVEMDGRYKKLAEVGVKNIDDYNELAGFVAMPKIVIVIDEMADVMLFAPSEVEESITRIAQMARAVGIHLVLSTQRPSVDVITGLIKANIPARLAFNVSSMQDSRVVLDMPGAEKLLGRGDMLFIPPDQAKPSRIQGAYVSDQETRSLIDFIKSQGQKPEYEDEITTKYQANTVKGGTGGATSLDDEKDQFFDDSVKLVLKAGKASSSLIQRRLAVGYARAARILDQLHEYGLVGPAEGSKPRDLNMTAIQQYLSEQAQKQGDA